MWVRQRRFLDTYPDATGCGGSDVFAPGWDLHFGAERNAVGHDDRCFDLLHDRRHSSNHRIQLIFQADFGFVYADHQSDSGGDGIQQQRGCLRGIHDQFASGGDSNVFSSSGLLHFGAKRDVV